MTGSAVEVDLEKAATDGKPSSVHSTKGNEVDVVLHGIDKYSPDGVVHRVSSRLLSIPA